MTFNFLHHNSVFISCFVHVFLHAQPIILSLDVITLHNTRWSVQVCFACYAVTTFLHLVYQQELMIHTCCSSQLSNIGSWHIILPQEAVAKNWHENCEDYTGQVGHPWEKTCLKHMNKWNVPSSFKLIDVLQVTWQTWWYSGYSLYKSTPGGEVATRLQPSLQIKI